MSQKIEPTKKKVRWYVAMVLGGVAGMVATTAVHPLDLIKVRLQLFSRYCTTREMARQIVRCRGYKALYAGLSAGLLRQTTYTTTRLGVYHALYNIYQRICKEEGVSALWRGGTLTLGRSVLVTIGQLGSYSQVREIFREKKLAKGLSLHIYTSFVSSFITAIFSLPIDLVKTRYQVKQSGVKLSEIFSDILHRKGIWYFWKGFVPYYIRMAIHTIVSLLVFDKLHQRYSSFDIEYGKNK